MIILQFTFFVELDGIQGQDAVSFNFTDLSLFVHISVSF